jgi:hypothetical protein
MTRRRPTALWLSALSLLAAAGGAALFSFWLAGGFQSAPAALVVVKAPATAASLKAEPLPVWTMRGGTQSTLEMVRRLRTAAAPELRAAFLSTRDHALRCAITARWAALDAPGCFQTLCGALDRTPADTGLVWGAMPVLFQQWAVVDPAAARAALREREDLRKFSLGPFTQTCAQLGGEAWTGLLDDPAFQMIMPPVSHQPRIGLDPLTPEKAMQTAAETVQRGRYGMLFQDMVWQAATGGDPQRALAEWRKLPVSQRQYFTNKVLAGLMEQDPAAGAAFMAELPPRERQMNAGTYAALLAKTDAPGAWTWLMEQPGQTRAESAHDWGGSVPPQEGVSVLAAAEPSPARDAAGAALASRWMENEPAAAAAWLMAVDDPAMKRRAWREAAATWAAKAPEQAVAAFLAPGAPPLSPDNVQEVTRALATTQPELARTFAAGLPPRLSATAQKVLGGGQ